MKANWGFSYVILSAPLKRSSISKRVDGTGRCYLLLAPSGPPCLPMSGKPPVIQGQKRVCERLCERVGEPLTTIHRGELRGELALDSHASVGMMHRHGN